jgi:hypothetical protein
LACLARYSRSAGKAISRRATRAPSELSSPVIQCALACPALSPAGPLAFSATTRDACAVSDESQAPRQAPGLSAHGRRLALVAAFLVALAVPVGAAVMWFVYRSGAPASVAILPTATPSPRPTAPLRTLAPFSPPAVVEPNSPPPFAPARVTPGVDLLWYSLPGDYTVADTRLRAVDWTGRAAGAVRFLRTGTNPDDIPLPSPDGRLFLLRGDVVAPSGQTVAKLETASASMVAWSDDSLHVCRLGFAGDPPGRISLAIATIGDWRWTNLTTLATEPDGANFWRLTACSVSRNVLVVTEVADLSGFPLRRMEVRRLSDGHLIHGVDYDTSPAPCSSCRAADSVLGSLDGSTLVECRAGAGCYVRRVMDDYKERHIDNALGSAVAAAFDGTVIAFEHGVVDVYSGTVLTTPPLDEIIVDAVPRPHHSDLGVFLGPSVSGPARKRLELVPPGGPTVAVPI